MNLTRPVIEVLDINVSKGSCHSLNRSASAEPEAQSKKKSIE